MQRLIFIFTAFLFSCTGSSRIKDPGGLAEKNKDVAILSLLIHNQLVKSRQESFDLNALVQKDSLKRISNNFKSLVMKSRAGHLSIIFQFADTRNAAVALTEQEKQQLQYVRWVQKKMKDDGDGEIWFDYGERFYRVRKIFIADK